MSVFKIRDETRGIEPAHPEVLTGRRERELLVMARPRAGCERGEGIPRPEVGELMQR